MLLLWLICERSMPFNINEYFAYYSRQKNYQIKHEMCHQVAFASFYQNLTFPELSDENMKKAEPRLFFCCGYYSLALPISLRQLHPQVLLFKLSPSPVLRLFSHSKIRAHLEADFVAHRGRLQRKKYAHPAMKVGPV